MTELFVFDVDELALLKQADNVANPAKVLADWAIPFDNHSLTFANPNANTGLSPAAAISINSFNFPEIALAEGKFSFNGPSEQAHKLPAELERLISQVATDYDCTPEEKAQMRESASRDIDGALTTYRALMSQTTSSLNEQYSQAKSVGMVLCLECSRQVNGRCLAATEGLIPGARREYSPVLNVFRRCSQYKGR